MDILQNLPELEGIEREIRLIPGVLRIYMGVIMNSIHVFSISILAVILFGLQLLEAADNPMESDTLSAAAERGKAAVKICMSCHDQELDPPQGPPLFGIQKRYSMIYPVKEEFVARMVSFVKEPQLDKAIMRRPVRILGLMPAMNLPEDQLSDIAYFIYENSFNLPCRHWEIAVKNAEKKGQVDPHIQKDKHMLEKFCQKP